MGLRLTKGDESSSRSLTVAVRKHISTPSRTATVRERTFNGVPMALQATKIGEDAGFSRSFNFNGLRRVFNGADSGGHATNLRQHNRGYGSPHNPR